MRLTLLCIVIFNFLHSQVLNRDFRYVDDITYLGSVYNVIKIGTPDDYILITTENIKDIHRTTPNLLDKSTQKGQTGVGHIISPVIDSIFFNWEAANSVCPTHWRIPRIGEWDTLFGSLNIDQKSFLFKDLPGLIVSEHSTEGDSIFKTESHRKNGFWWSSDLSTDSEAYIIELDGRRNIYKRKTNTWNGASVRCIYKETEE